MKIPSHYCPHCKRFRKWYQVTNIDANDYGYCKYCGTGCYDTTIIVKILLENEEKIAKLLNEEKQ